jgi:hypothetical protein
VVFWWYWWYFGGILVVFKVLGDREIEDIRLRASAG